jgi:NAD(P)-dependent dehydrogenase (short-subunit alcohol dehydrogenase family)
MSGRDLNDAVVAVVGAAGGLGAPIAACLAARGARVVLAGPHRDRLESSVPMPGDLVVQLDLRARGAGDLLVDAVSARYGRLDGVVNAAGLVAFGNLTDTPDEVIEELFLTNVLGPLWLAKRVAPMLAESRGFLLMISAVLAEQPLAGMAAYGASKAALSSAGRSLTRELRRQGITVTDVRPPHTETGLATRAIGGTPPRLPVGLDPATVAERIVRAIEDGEQEVSSAQFSPSDPG